MVTPFDFAHSPVKTTLWVFITKWLKPWKGKDWMLLSLLILRYCWESHLIQLSNHHLSIPNAHKGSPPAKWCWQPVWVFISVKENNLRASTIICRFCAPGLWGTPNDCFCEISPRRSKCCRKLSSTWGQLTVSMWPFHSCTIFEAYLINLLRFSEV